MSKPLRVLLVEDSPSDAKLVIQELQKTGRVIEFERVDTAEAMRAALERQWDIVLSDWAMPKFSAPAALDILREKDPDLPFVIVSGTIGEETAVEAMRTGAGDFVLKDKLGRLTPAIERELREYQDRAARKQAEANMRESELRYRTLFDTLIEGFCTIEVIFDDQGKAVDYRFLEINPAFEKQTGLHDAQGKLMRDLAPNHEEHWFEMYGHVALTGEPVQFENEAKALGRHYDVCAYRVGGPESRKVAILFNDITERKRTELALRESEARFRRLSESGIIGIVTADVNGNILDANYAYLNLVGYSREELIQGVVRWADLIPPEFAHLAAKAVEQLQTDGAASPWETESFRKDGSRFPALIGVAMLDYPKCIAFVADLTQRKQAEAGLRRAEEALHQSEEQLRQAQKMEAVGRLAGGVAHDFNNVLSVILSYSEFLLADLKATDPMRDDVGEIRTAAKRAAGLTRQLLLFSRQQVVEPKVLDLHEVLTDMDKMLQRIVGEDVEVLLVERKAVGRVKVDPSHIEQVVLNLVVNARDAMPKGGKLTIETSNVVLDDDYELNHLPAKAGSYVMLAVSDTGAGMDRETQKRIFEPFFTTKEQGKGTGLGLSTVFGIVQQSGGNIWVYSEPGKGTTFKIYLPRVDAELDVLQPPVEPTSLRGSETILLVEDEEQVRAVALSILRKQGYQVIVAQHAGEALLICERHAEVIHLLVTDVVMPQMSGPELAKRLVAVRPEMKVLCLSGYTDDSIVRHGVLDAGAAFLQKPITPASLARKVREVLDNKGATRSASPPE